MRASRLLRMVLLLQNSGRMTSQQLADELEVTSRTILRDVDALTGAGLPVVVHQGNRGRIELGFNYRTRLTGLTSDEAEALAIILMHPVPELQALGLHASGGRARAKEMRVVHPIALRRHHRRWWIVDNLCPGVPIALSQCRHINISALTFD